MATFALLPLLSPQLAAGAVALLGLALLPALSALCDPHGRRRLHPQV
jgi:hypothetical protein